MPVGSPAIWRRGQGESCVHLRSPIWRQGMLPARQQPPPMAFMRARANVALWSLKSETSAAEVSPTNRRRLGKSVASLLLVPFP